MRLLHLNIIIRCDIVTLHLEPMVHILCIQNKTACHITLLNKMKLQGLVWHIKCATNFELITFMRVWF